MADTQRMKLQQQIADLDREINQEVAKAGRVGSLRVEEVNFPIGTWILTLAVAAWWYAGGRIQALESLHEPSAFWAFLIAVILGLVAAWRTLMWAKRKASRQKGGYSEAAESDKVVALRKKRAGLQKELESLQKG